MQGTQRSIGPGVRETIIDFTAFAFGRGDASEAQAFASRDKGQVKLLGRALKTSEAVSLLRSELSQHRLLAIVARPVVKRCQKNSRYFLELPQPGCTAPAPRTGGRKHSCTTLACIERWAHPRSFFCAQKPLHRQSLYYASKRIF